MSEQLFRYAACGGGNLVLDWVLYFLVYNFVIGHEIVNLQFTILNSQFTQAITPHIATLCIVFPITLLTGFWLQKNITFTQSDLHSARQLFRYILIVAVNLAINYFGLKLCVEILGWYPTPSKMFITLITVAVSYLGQKHFTFAKQ
jgi:putative flippase GtrA